LEALYYDLPIPFDISVFIMSIFNCILSPIVSPRPSMILSIKIISPSSRNYDFNLLPMPMLLSLVALIAIIKALFTNIYYPVLFC